MVHPYGSDAVGHGSMMTFQLPKSEPALVPQQAIGAQYLEPVPYVSAVRAVGALGAVGTVAPLGAVGTVAPLGVATVAPLGAVGSVGALGSLSIPTLPVIVTPDQAQTQVRAIFHIITSALQLRETICFYSKRENILLRNSLCYISLKR